MRPLSSHKPSELEQWVLTDRVRIAVGTLVAVASLLGSTSVWATGFRPFAGDDSATVTRGGSVSILDSGATSVLDNDLDFEGDILFAILDDDVDHGTLMLNPDGTFLYVHDGKKGKDDRFRYRTFDGTRFSRSADVRIKIIDGDPGPPRITAQQNITTNEDEPRLLTLQDLVIEGGNGNPQLWVGEGANYTVTGVTIVPAGDFNGILNPPVRVNDGNFDSNTFILDVEVRPVNDPPFVIGPVPDQLVQEGEFFELRLAQQFGDIDAEGDLIFAATGLPPSRSLVLNRSTGTLSGTPQLADAQDVPFDVTITVEDKEQATASLSFRLTIVPTIRSDLELTLSVQPSPAIFTNSPLWAIKVENLGPGSADEGTLTAAWFSSEAPITLSLIGNGCTLAGNDTLEPEISCPLSGLPAHASISVLVQSAHQVPGDTHVTAWVAPEDFAPENNVAALSLNLAASFSEGPAQNLNTSASDLASADLNGDGQIDLVVAGEELKAYFNTGERELASLGLTLGPGGEGSSVALIDWNMDGASDVGIAYVDSRAGQLYINDGTGVFPQILQLPVTNVSAMVSADLNGDGHLELVVSGVGGTREIRNDGQGQPQVVSISGTVARHVSTGDLDMNGLPDLVLTATQTRAIHLLLNNADGNSFSESILTMGSVASVNVHDVDGDGGADLLVATDGTDLDIPISHVLRNQLDGSFTVWAQVGASPTTELIAGDVTGDGISDLIAINKSGVHQLYVGDNLGGFALDEQHVLALDRLRGYLGDINDDASLDLLLAGVGADTVDIYANNGRGRFGIGDTTPPIISLVGESIVIIDVNTPFVDSGATALDDIDGDVTVDIVVDNPINTSILGSYTVTYAVTDRAGNLGQATRAVRVNAVTGAGGGGGGTIGYLFVILLAGLLTWRLSYLRKRVGVLAPLRRYTPAQNAGARRDTRIVGISHRADNRDNEQILHFWHPTHRATRISEMRDKVVLLKAALEC